MSEPVVEDPNEFTGEEFGDESTPDVLAKFLDALATERGLQAADRQALEDAANTSSAARSAGESLANQTAVARAHARVEAEDLSSDEQELADLTPDQSQELKESASAVRETVEDLAADATQNKGPLYTRLKLWSWILGLVVATTTSVTAIVAAVLLQKAREQGDPSDGGTDVEDLSPELKALLQQRADEWKALRAGQLCDRISAFADAYAQSILAQVTVVRELKLLLAPADPQEQSSYEAFLVQVAPALGIQAEDAYIATTSVPRYRAVYAFVKATQKPAGAWGAAGPLTSLEAVAVLEIALSRIHVMLKNTGG
ncbi:hypothetical protein Bcav_2659 [Beutenbergia cavernae DSM 12333]|uniref:Transmembrane protein n=1 Tax=Beutenbergia cavernae (strain ATCC BAA-8 / DSM 12333 / CCUG 43141 / JCM 11478 / NBRC 16432 / NCIMB 13614 / HKI 0122) TaxID=471853 RepID=C5BXM1_BEUC1|nr:hypothetical protein [Beutenbergia cavernae]ACQ80904.1 hypothetical protein Bcav_2659 [Beutenbergia cavernae DSM 12333]